ncbi:MAG: dicarboxylate/amino acid:cation symporter [Candidatus Woesearchaeota archaeon]
MKSIREHITGKKHNNRILLSLHNHLSHLLHTKLWLKVLIALVLGSVAGICLGPDMNFISQSLGKTITDWLALPGHIFLSLIKMIIIPLVFSSIIVGIVSSGSSSFLKKIGPRMAIYFIITTTIAIIIGFSVTSIIQPGSYINPDSFTSLSGEKDVVNTDMSELTGAQGASIPDKIVNIIPSNPFKSMVNGDLLGVVIISIIVGLAMLSLSKEHFKTMVSFLEGVQEITMRIIKWVMHIVPLAVFGLIAQVTSKIGFDALAGLGVYILTVLSGLALLIIVYNLIIFFFTSTSPRAFMRDIKEAQLLAFSTSSSAAVMPLSMKIGEDKLHVKKAISEFLIPVGATVNMDGTALYQAAATIFLAQAFGVTLSIASLVGIVVITVGASIGTPSVPGVGIVVLATILQSAGIPAAGIALILGVDRILDMSRTTINVTGNLAACLYFDKKMAPMLNPKPTIEEK